MHSQADIKKPTADENLHANLFFYGLTHMFTPIPAMYPNQYINVLPSGLREMLSLANITVLFIKPQILTEMGNTAVPDHQKLSLTEA